MRRVGLVLIDPRRRRILRLLHVVEALVLRRGGVVTGHAVRSGLVGRAGHDHEALGDRDVVSVAEDMVRPCDERIIIVQRHDDRAATLGHEIQPVIEELAEEREHQVERRRQTEVRRDVRNEQRARYRIRLPRR